MAAEVFTFWTKAYQTAHMGPLNRVKKRLRENVRDLKQGVQTEQMNICEGNNLGHPMNVDPVSPL